MKPIVGVKGWIYTVDGVQSLQNGELGYDHLIVTIWTEILTCMYLEGLKPVSWRDQ